MNDAVVSTTLRSGTLRLNIERADLPLRDLFGFGSRRSRKRGFVFVSKVLGKHVPVRPSCMADIHTRLAEKLGDPPGPIVLIALAETATALGHGVAEAWVRRTGRDDLLFLHTTRYRLNHPIALNFDEPHSHATEHLLYRPVRGDHAELFDAAQTLVLVDDEISTGRTLANLALAYRARNPRLESVHLVCITDWLDAERRDSLASQIGVPIRFVNLLQGTYTFHDDPTFDPGPIPDAVGSAEPIDALLSCNHGRLGVCGLVSYDLDTHLDALGLRPDQRVLVLGTGEFSYPPFLLARRLEELGWDVHFQSTTRSPLCVDGDIASVLEFPDNYHDGIANYVYNVANRWYDKIVIGYETSPLPTNHNLAQKLNGGTAFF